MINSQLPFLISEEPTKTAESDTKNEKIRPKRIQSKQEKKTFSFNPSSCFCFFQVTALPPQKKIIKKIKNIFQILIQHRHQIP